jgi:hypothetical protein
VFEPLELLEKLAALTPRPRINLVLYHGVLAPHAGWRARVVADSAPLVEARAAASESAEPSDDTTAAPKPRHWGVGRSDEARVRYRRARLPAMRRAPALDRHRGGS